MNTRLAKIISITTRHEKSFKEQKRNHYHFNKFLKTAKLTQKNKTKYRIVFRNLGIKIQRLLLKNKDITLFSLTQKSTQKTPIYKNSPPNTHKNILGIQIVESILNNTFFSFQPDQLSIKKQEDIIPKELQCPISLLPMKSPQILDISGQTYDKVFLIKWITEYSKPLETGYSVTDPLTGIQKDYKRNEYLQLKLNKFVYEIKEEWRRLFTNALIKSASSPINHHLKDKFKNLALKINTDFCEGNITEIKKAIEKEFN